MISPVNVTQLETFWKTLMNDQVYHQLMLLVVLILWLIGVYCLHPEWQKPLMPQSAFISTIVLWQTWIFKIPKNYPQKKQFWLKRMLHTCHRLAWGLLNSRGSSNTHIFCFLFSWIKPNVHVEIWLNQCSFTLFAIKKTLRSLCWLCQYWDNDNESGQFRSGGDCENLTASPVIQISISILAMDSELTGELDFKWG